MKKMRKLLCALLVLALLLSLGAAAGFADDDQPAEESAPDESTSAAEGDALPAAEVPAPAEGQDYVLCAAGEVRSAVSGLVVCEEGGVVFNNGATVYNNGGVVYNNFGTVFANAGTTYNNSGVMYVNGGSAFNNAGTVFSNLPGEEARVEDEETPTEADAAPAEGEEAPKDTDSDAAEEAPQTVSWPLTVSFAEDYSLFVDWNGLRLDGEGTLLLDEDAALTIRPMPGFSIIEALSSSGSFTADEDGAWTLDGAAEDLTVTLRLRPAAPVTELAAGVHAAPLELELTAAAPAVIRYTLDGSEPDAESEAYSAPLTITESCTVRARAYLGALEPGEELTLPITIPVITIPEFPVLTVGYGESALESVAVRISNTGDEEIRILSAALAGEEAGRFRLSTGEGGVIEANETRDTHWTITPKLNLPAGEYTAEFVVKLRGGESMSVPFTLEVKEA